MYGPIRQCNDLLDYPVGPYRVVASLRRVLPTTFGYTRRPLPAVRVERFVERDAEKGQRSGCRQCDDLCHRCS